MYKGFRWRALRGLPIGMAALIACFMLAAAKPGAARPEEPLGNWLTEDRNAVISIGSCGNALCGRIVGIPLAVEGEPIPTDNQGQSQCNLIIIRNWMPDSADWKAQIIDPRDGSTYRVLLQLDKQRRLRVRGYLGITLLGRTQVWTPFTDPVPADCRLPPRIP